MSSQVTSAIISTAGLVCFLVIILFIERGSRKGRKERKAADQQAVRIAQHIRKAKKPQDVLFFNMLMVGLPGAWEDVKKVLDELEEAEISKRELARMFSAKPGAEE